MPNDFSCRGGVCVSECVLGTIHKVRKGLQEGRGKSGKIPSITLALHFASEVASEVGL